MLDASRLGFNAFWWEGMDSGDKVKRTAEELYAMGYRWVEWKETSFTTKDCFAKGFSDAVRISRSEGLRVSDGVILRNIADPAVSAESVRDISEFVRVCAAAGVDKVNFASGGRAAGSRATDAELWNGLQKSAEQLTAVAEREKVTLIMEPVVGNTVREFFTAKKLYDSVPSPWFCMTMDPSHYVLMQQDLPQIIRCFGREKIRHVHMKDSVGRPGSYLFPILGEGETDWNAFLGALDGIGYDGCLSVEFESWGYMSKVLHNDPAEAARLSMRSAQAILENYKNSRA